MQELGESETEAQWRKNIIPSVDMLLKPSKEEGAVLKYLSRAERKKAEEERRLAEERQRQLSNDDTTVRALTAMMGNSLDEKREKQAIEL